MKKFIIILGFFVIFQNNTKDPLYHWFYYVTHPHDSLCALKLDGGALLDPDESVTLPDGYPPGVYYYSWYNQDRTWRHDDYFLTDDRTKIVIITPNGVEIEYTPKNKESP